ncbi:MULTISPECIES: alpha/beta hydrolase [Sediminibacillus]|uniref:alpha/beta hydrolase n=1 Tax=Sediminibacillus TaxID=482460 RepID=UPI0004BA5354|nr:alpha/beta hydrolase [Sediminibacillus terrae]
MEHFQNDRNDSKVFHVKKVGDGKPVVFLPAAGFSGLEGMNIAERLRPAFQTHLVDLPGYGQSEGINKKCTTQRLADWLKEYLDQEKIDCADIVAHSLGGAIALSLSVHYPERVKQLILLDSGHKPYPRIPFQEFGPFALLFPLLNVGYHLFGISFMARLAGLFSGNSAESENKEEEIERFCHTVGIDNSVYVQEALRHPPKMTASGMNLLFGYYNMNLPELVKKLELPTYLIYGTFADRDKKQYRLTKKSIERLQHHKQLPVEYLPVNSGHYVHWSSEEVVDKLARILDQPSNREDKGNQRMLYGSN